MASRARRLTSWLVLVSLLAAGGRTARGDVGSATQEPPMAASNGSEREQADQGDDHEEPRDPATAPDESAERARRAERAERRAVLTRRLVLVGALGAFAVLTTTAAYLGRNNDTGRLATTVAFTVGLAGMTTVPVVGAGGGCGPQWMGICTAVTVGLAAVGGTLGLIAGLSASQRTGFSRPVAAFAANALLAGTTLTVLW